MPPTETGREIEEILAQRSDLSTFIVHLTKDNGCGAKENLESIISSWTIEARNSFGSAKDRSKVSQKCVCFTETPLEHIHLLIGKIKGRSYEFKPYGVAITKRLARQNKVNPVWYVEATDQTTSLMTHINELIQKPNGTFEESPISKITPFIEQMGDWRPTGTRKEFWWERELRHVGNFKLPNHVIIICQDENDNHKRFEKMAMDSSNSAEKHSAKCIDATWGLEKIIARLAGFGNEDI